MLSTVESTRLAVSKNTSPSKKAKLGQFFTPQPIASFMTGLFSQSQRQCYLLDAGAGIGSLSAAMLSHCNASTYRFASIEIDAFELDEGLIPYLEEALQYRPGNGDYLANIYNKDFIAHASLACSAPLLNKPSRQYSHAVLNPPYKKINSKSSERLALRSAGIETVNLYSGFVALALEMLAPKGELVAIIPRSFTNGPYYKPFREFILQRAAIQQLHIFKSRTQAFKDDNVLQENVIILLKKDANQQGVTVSTSTDGTFSDYAERELPFEKIVPPNNRDRFIHIPTANSSRALEAIRSVKYGLADIGLNVSTGPVVDFRLKEHLRKMPEDGTVPLIYPAHIAESQSSWPIPEFKKYNAIAKNSETERWLYPNGYYCLVRRFSSKEEKRRINAAILDPSSLPDSDVIGLENHLNVFHSNKNGIPKALAHGLALYLNTTAVDENFRCYNGHTQVNATDLKQMQYPSRELLMQFGQWGCEQAQLTQSMIDQKFKEIIA